MIKETEKFNVLSPKNDYIFKKMFSKKENESMLKDFVQGFFEEKIKTIEVNRKLDYKIDVISRKKLYVRFKSNISK